MRSAKELKKRLEEIGISSEMWYTIDLYRECLITLLDRVAKLEAEAKKGNNDEDCD